MQLKQATGVQYNDEEIEIIDFSMINLLLWWMKIGNTIYVNVKYEKEWRAAVA